MGESTYPVFFVRTRTARPIPGQRCILLTFASEDWNDFTYRTLFYYRVFDGHSHTKPIFHGDTHVGFWDRDESPDDIVKTLLKGANAPVRAKKFYTLHNSMQDYRDLVEQLGIVEAGALLLALQDLVAVQRLPERPEWFDRATVSDVFTFSFIRNADPFFAFHNAAPLLDGAAEESIDRISRQLTLHFQIPTFLNAHHIEFDFEPKGPLSRRIAVLIGKNGTGKSRALFHVVNALLQDNEDLRALGKRPQVNRLIAVSGPGETGSTFPAPNREKRIYYRRILLQRPRADADQVGLGTALLQLRRAHGAIKEVDRWTLFLDAIQEIGPAEQIFIQPNKASNDEDGSAPFSLSSLGRLGEQESLRRFRRVHATADLCRVVDGKICPLSSGEVTFVRFAIQVCLHIENATLLVFDEPETHLHPNLVAKFVSLLDELLKSTGSIAILATHSAYFVREVPRSQVHVFQLEEGRIHIGPPRLRTFGADIGAISEFVFGDDLFGRLITDLKTQLGDDSAAALAELANELSPEALMFLRKQLESDLL